MNIGGGKVRSERMLLAKVENGKNMMSADSVRFLVLHCSASRCNQDYSVEQLRRDHKARLTGVLFSEMQSARAGLGYLLTESQNLLNTPRMFFLIILITLLSVGAVKLIDAIEYAISYRWRHV